MFDSEGGIARSYVQFLYYKSSSSGLGCATCACISLQPDATVAFTVHVCTHERWHNVDMPMEKSYR